MEYDYASLEVDFNRVSRLLTNTKETITKVCIKLQQILLISYIYRIIC